MTEIDRHQVGRAVLIASMPGDEASVAAAVARHPARFVGFFMVNPRAEAPSTRSRAALDEHGLRGVCLFPAMHRYSLQDARGRAHLRGRRGDAGRGVFVHCGVLSVGVRKKLGLPSRSTCASATRSTPAPPSTFPQRADHRPALRRRLVPRGADARRTCAPTCPLDTSSSNGWIKYHPA